MLCKKVVLCDYRAPWCSANQDQAKQALTSFIIIQLAGKIGPVKLQRCMVLHFTSALFSFEIVCKRAIRN